MHFTSVNRACDLGNDTRLTFATIFLEKTLPDFFSGIVWIDNLHDLMNKFVSLTMAAMEIGKRQF